MWYKSFIIFFWLLSISIYPQLHWKWISPYPPYKGVYSSTQAEGKAYFWCGDNAVIKLDISKEKFKMLPTYAPLNNVGLGDGADQGIAFADSLTGYITDLAHGEYRTTDGGQNWIKTANEGSNESLVTFVSNLRGWKLGIGGFYTTNDAGLTWTPLNAPFFGGYGYFSKMYALDENKIWVLKSFYYSGNEGSIWYSPDGGHNWSNLNTGLISDSLNQVRYSDIKINSSGIGFAVGNIFRPDSNITDGFIQKTTDTGQTWSTKIFRNEIYKNILSINDNEWLILGSIGNYSESKVVQRKTSDMGGTWIQSFPLQNIYENTRFYNAIYTKENDIIYMFATYGIYKSINRGNSYSKITSDTDVLVTEIAFDSKPDNPDNQIGIAWLKWNIKPYLITFDGGHTWHQKSLPQSMGYIWLVGISEQVIYMITNQSDLYKSTDFGETWQQLSIPVYGGLQALNVYSRDVFVLYGYKNLVSSTDGGNTWVLGPTIKNIFLENTDIISPGNIVGVGSYYDSSGTSGSFFKTTNYGLSWHIIDTDKELYEVQMVSDMIGFALGDNRFYRTWNSGESWGLILSNGGYYHTFSCFSFLDSLNGIVNVAYDLKRTTDGGASWVTGNCWIPSGGIEKLVYNAKGDLFALGGGAMLMLQSDFKSLPEDKGGSGENNSVINVLQNYPNPFNPVTTIKYSIPSSVSTGGRNLVTLKVYDVLGNEVATLVNEEKPAGEYEVKFDASRLASGVYFYQLRSGSFIETKKMILLK
jgi:photosystem II stability/assembly factor-like uncharacterized protein